MFPARVAVCEVVAISIYIPVLILTFNPFQVRAWQIFLLHFGNRTASKGTLSKGEISDNYSLNGIVAPNLENFRADSSKGKLDNSSG